MKNTVPFVVGSFLFSAILSQISAETSPLADTVVEGDLSVQVDAQGGKGNLIVDGNADLGVQPLDWPLARATFGLDALNFYGPVRLGETTVFGTYEYEKNDVSQGLTLPLGALNFARSATIEVSTGGNSVHSAKWDLLKGDNQYLISTNHQAHGMGQHFNLYYGNGVVSSYLAIKYEGPSGVTFNELKVNVVLQSNYQDPIGDSNFSPSLPVRLTNSTIYQVKSHDDESLNSVVTSWDGDSMGLTGDVSVNGSPVLTQGLASAMFVPATGGVVDSTSFAIGSGNNSSVNSASIGVNNIVVNSSLAVGTDNKLLNQSSDALVVGNGNISSEGGFVTGNLNYLNTADSFIMGTSNYAGYGGGSNVIIGEDNSLWGVTGGWIIGKGLELAGFGDPDETVVLGTYNRDPSDPTALIVGNGVDELNRSNALEVYKNGDVIITKPQGDISMGNFGTPQQ